MSCAYGGACEGATWPFWIRSVGIPLCDLHRQIIRNVRTNFGPGSDPRALELLASAAMLLLGTELVSREEHTLVA